MARARGTTTEEILSVDGVVLNTYAKNIESLTGRLRTPARRTGNIRVPGRHGAIRTRGKKYDENVLALPMWVVGCDDDGHIPTDQTQRTMFFQNVDALTHLFSGADDEPLDVRHTWPDGSIRQCFAEVLDVLDFTTSSANPIGKFAVSLTMNDPFWRDLDVTTQTRQADGSSAAFSEFRGATAPMEDLIVRLRGPWTNPRLTFTDGSWVQYNAVIPENVTLTIDSSAWTVSASSGLTATIDKLVYSGSSSHWVAIPGPGDKDPVIKLSGAGRTVETSLELEGRRKFLVG